MTNTAEPLGLVRGPAKGAADLRSSLLLGAGLACGLALAAHGAMRVAFEHPSAAAPTQGEHLIDPAATTTTATTTTPAPAPGYIAVSPNVASNAAMSASQPMAATNSTATASMTAPPTPVVVRPAARPSDTRMALRERPATARYAPTQGSTTTYASNSVETSDSITVTASRQVYTPPPAPRQTTYAAPTPQPNPYGSSQTQTQTQAWAPQPHPVGQGVQSYAPTWTAPRPHPVGQGVQSYAPTQSSAPHYANPGVQSYAPRTSSPYLQPRTFGQASQPVRVGTAAPRQLTRYVVGNHLVTVWRLPNGTIQSTSQLIGSPATQSRVFTVRRP